MQRNFVQNVYTVAHIGQFTYQTTKKKTFSPFSIFCLQQSQVCFPFIAYHLSACKAAYWDNHGCNPKIIK
jgi:hypothetical protein